MDKFNRLITLIFFSGCLLFSCVSVKAGSQAVSQIGDKVKVIIDNDFSGDPDGLFQLAHQLLCKTCDVQAIIGGHLSSQDSVRNNKNMAEVSCEKANEVLGLLRMTGKFKVVSGAANGMLSTDKPIESEGAKIILEEAIKCTPEKPLYVLCGASLTNIASAYLINHLIEDRVILIWIGGLEYNNLGAYPPPVTSKVEYNLGLSISAAQVIFNKSKMRIWQVPRNAYLQCLYGFEEIKTKIEPYGKIGKYLSNELDNSLSLYKNYGLNIGEAYILGDSPLVLLSTLHSFFVPDPSSSQYKYIQSPAINDDGTYGMNHSGRMIRVYTTIDTRLMFEDFEAKLKLNFPVKR